MNLAGLIEALKALPPEQAIVVDYTGKAPGRLCSWRGRYNELTIDTAPWDEDNRCLTVGALLVDANLAVGRTFEGYKVGAAASLAAAKELGNDRLSTNPLRPLKWGSTTAGLPPGFVNRWESSKRRTQSERIAIYQLEVES